MNTMELIHKQRIQQELERACVPRLSLKTFASRHLHNVIQDDEHIIAAINGFSKSGSGLFGTCMLVATDKRIIFYDHKPGFTVMEEAAYDEIRGIRSAEIGPFTMVRLHTAAGDYQLNHVNRACARAFVKYVDKCKLEVYSRLNQPQ